MIKYSLSGTNFLVLCDFSDLLLQNFEKLYFVYVVMFNILIKFSMKDPSKHAQAFASAIKGR
jgi:hypothetical protein